MVSNGLWRTIFLGVCVLGIVFGFKTVQMSMFNRTHQLQVYNAWYGYMQIAGEDLQANGTPLVSLHQADSELSNATSYAQGAAELSSGRLSQMDVLLGLTAEKVNEEVQLMEGNQPLTSKDLIEDRKFIGATIANDVLKGMPVHVSSVAQIEQEFDHLNTLDIGVNSPTSTHFMVKTGQMTLK